MRNLSIPETIDSFDFVLIEADDGIFREMNKREDGADDDSYDYCVDAFSMHSCGEDSEDKTLIDMRDSVLSVPDTIMNNLDDAHAAAKLVKFDEDEAPSGPLGGEESFISTLPTKKSDPYSSSSSVVSMEEEDGEDSSPKKHGRDSSSAFLATKYYDKLEEMGNPLRFSVDATVASTESHPETNGENDHEQCAGDVDPSTSTNEGKHSTNRISNKKRRKKLKMLKKAQAAASAAKKLSENKRHGTTTISSQSKSSSKKCKTPIQQQSEATQKAKPRTSKKIGNIAVACAKETIAAYREELLLRSIS
jgi:hypothetical protein